MKKIIFLAVFFMVGALFAQTTTDYIYPQINPNGWYADLTVALDSADQVWTEAFNLANVDEVSFSTYPFGYGMDAAAADSIHITVYWYVSYDNSNWIVADTLGSITDATAAKGTTDLNNVKAPYYKLLISNDTASKANTSFKFGLYHPMND